MPPRRACIAAVLSLLVLAGTAAAASADDPPAAPAKVRRWESNLSVGSVSNGRLGVVKSIWWYALPKYIALGLSFDYIYEAIPMSIDVALNAPLGPVIPFACAGAGGSLTVGGMTFYGAGVKIRLSRKFGLIGEYRHYRYSHDSTGNPATKEMSSAGYFGGGIAWLY
jgi:hypothetical protein